MHDKPYQPIACVNYELFEVAILRKRPLHLIWSEDNVIYDQTITPVNLETRQGEEFLILRDAQGESHRVRLDRIRHVTEAA